MVKRKRDAFPPIIHMQPVEDATGTTVGPFAVYFPSGFKPSSEASCTWHVYTHKKHKHQHIIVARTDKVDFVGRTQGGEYVGHLPCRYAIGMLDKATGKMQAMSAEAGRIIRMEPRCPGVNYEDTGAGVRSEPLDAETRMKEYKRLIEQFGSTRRKRQLTAKENAVVTADAVGGAEALTDMLKVAADKAAESNMTKDDIINQTQALRAIPPHHPEATKPHDAYRLSELVPRDCNQALSGVVRQLQRGIDEPEFVDGVMRPKRMFAAYVLAKLPYMKNMSSDVFERRLSHLALLGTLLNLYIGPPMLKLDTTRAGGLTFLSKRTNVPMDMLDHFLAKFYQRRVHGTSEIYDISRDSKGLLLLYVLIVAVLAEDGEMTSETFESLRECLRMASIELVSRLRELGCVCTAAKGSPAASSMKPYSVSLLPAQTVPPKTLRDYFPNLKIGRRK
ncbi:hypothetical protein ABBQ38_010286 [Trebouxia sp. C0009 RCD-2024]